MERYCVPGRWQRAVSGCGGDTVRAEHASLADAGAPNSVAAKVGHVEHLGDVCIVYAQVEGVGEMLALKLAGKCLAQGG